VTLLSREIAKVLNRPDVKERHFNTGVETVASTPEELAARIKSEMAKWGKVIRDAGIRPDKS
ncbi:MAG TPA: tripartite tricarboxylate transporter substrate binding protein, partial [Burkholderiales bacterium]|nr:tripartite tricarboxylate transporter substrate binding protein [Burkholderiales bacterium]